MRLPSFAQILCAAPYGLPTCRGEWLWQCHRGSFELRAPMTLPHSVSTPCPSPLSVLKASPLLVLLLAIEQSRRKKMTKEGFVTRAVYKGENETFIVIVESEKAVQDWKKDSTIPLTQVVNAFQVFVGNGAQGILDRPSKQQLENENEDDIVKKIITDGKLETSKHTSHKFTEQNQSNGSGGAGGR